MSILSIPDERLKKLDQAINETLKRYPNCRIHTIQKHVKETRYAIYKTLHAKTANKEIQATPLNGQYGKTSTYLYRLTTTGKQQ